MSGYQCTSYVNCTRMMIYVSYSIQGRSYDDIHHTNEKDVLNLGNFASDRLNYY